jgi:serine/threonine protein kinase
MTPDGIRALDFPSIPGYKVEKVLGQGGMACVYLAIQENFDRHVALKVMAEHLVRDESFAKRFLKEAKTVARLSHQSIVPVFDVGAVGNYHYMAMEFLPGGDLKHKMRAGLSLLESIKIVKAIAAGLHYAGNKGLVHRDIKPENILFREDNSPVISDFGIVRDTDSKTNMTVTGAVIGTPHYMSPEQAEGASVDPRSDLYSLGIILYEMLTGHVPFTGESAVSIGIKHITEMPEALPQDVAGFQKVIDNILAKHPDDRYQSGEEFIAALSELEHNLSDSGAKTIVMSRDDIRRSSRGKQTGRTSARTGARAPTAMRRQNTAPPESKAKTVFLASTLSVAVALAGAGGLWYFMGPSGDVRPPVPTAQLEELDPVLKSKTQELLGLAETAVAEDRLYLPVNDNAQHYLTTLLALFPDHPQGKVAVEELFGLFMANANASMSEGDLAQAATFLNQASQISFYISNKALQEDFANLYRSMNNLRQKALISQEKQRLIDSLLVKADAALAAGSLTAPSDNNAYDLYQQVLVEDADNQLAKMGLQNISARFLEKARAESDKKSFGLAKAFVAAAIQVDAQHPQIAEVQQAIQAAEDEEAKRQLASENQKVTELEKARTAREEGLKQKQKRISDWLSAAALAFKDNRLTEPADGNALSYYEKVLAEEPANIQALQGKERVGSRYIELARKAIEKDEFELAAEHLVSASGIVSSNVELARANRELDARKEQKRIEDIIAKGDEALASDRLTAPEKENALYYYETVLAEDPSNVSAQQGRERVGMRFIELAKEAVEKNKFDDAEKFLGTAREISTSVVEIEVATNMLGQARLAMKSEKERKIALAEQQRLDQEKERAEAARRKLSRTESLLDEAKDIDKAKDSSENNARLRAIYQEVLKIESGNRAALNGLNKTSDYEAVLAKSSIEQRNFNKALQHIAMISSTTPKYNGLNKLRSELAEAQSGHDKATALLSTASGLINSPYEKPGLFGNNDDAREKLIKAYQNIDQARQTDPNHPELNSVLGSLEDKYIRIVKTLAKDGDYKDAQAFIGDTRRFQWTAKQLAAVEKDVLNDANTIKKSAPKAMGGF